MLSENESVEAAYSHVQVCHHEVGHPGELGDGHHCGSKSENGNEHLLVIVDTFSRYVQLIPIPELTAMTATRALVKWMNTFGKPFSILTDNATQFQEVLAHLGIDDRRIHPYSHEENSIVERTNKEVERHLRDIMFHEKVIEKWDEFCPIR